MRINLEIILSPEGVKDLNPMVTRGQGDFLCLYAVAGPWNGVSGEAQGVSDSRQKNRCQCHSNWGIPGFGQNRPKQSLSSENRCFFVQKLPLHEGLKRPFLVTWSDIRMSLKLYVSYPLDLF